MSKAKASAQKTSKRRKTTAQTKIDYSLKQKLEVILVWECNGHVLDGKRVTHKEMAERLELTEYRLGKLIKETQKSFIQTFQNESSMRELVYGVVGTFLHQIKDDRARAVIHADNLSALIDQLTSEYNKTLLMSEGTPTESKKKKRRCAHLQTVLKQLFVSRNEGLRVLNLTSQSLHNFMSLFAPDKNGQSTISEWMQLGQAAGNGQLVTYMEAIRIVESSSASVLPRQDNNCFIQGPRNPNDGFEELAEQPNDGAS